MSLLDLNYEKTGKNGTVALIAKMGDDVLAAEKVDILRRSSREKLIEKVCGDHPQIDRKELDGQLIAIAEDVIRAPEAVDTEASAPAAAELLAKMDPKVVSEAESMLADPKLAHRILDDVAALGIAGELPLILTIYMVGVSRLLSRPLAAIAQGQSSSGKSHIVEQTATLFPREAVVHATQMTPQALFHMRPGSLEHRFVVAGERSRNEDGDQAEATRALREMISSGRLVKLMPVKVGNEIVTVTIEQNGPIAFIESTTLSKIFEEDLNRSILVSTDEREEQTRRVISKLAARYAGDVDGTREAAIVARHHAAQRMLQPFDVVVPFAEVLGEKFTDQRVEARRAFPQLMSMIQASALLHQRQRCVYSDGRLEASAADYTIAAWLLEQPFARQLGGKLSDAASRFFIMLQDWAGPTTFTTPQAIQRDKSSPASIYGWIGELHRVGYLDQVEVGRGRQPATWRLADHDGDHPPASILPKVEEVLGK